MPADRREEQILRLIASERYAEFDRELAEYLGTADLSDAAAVARVREFLAAALDAARTRRAHAEAALVEVRAAQAFFGPKLPQPSVEVVG